MIITASTTNTQCQENGRSYQGDAADASPDEMGGRPLTPLFTAKIKRPRLTFSPSSDNFVSVESTIKAGWPELREI